MSEGRVSFIGAPFCEGQNLEGADLGPTALREAGLGKAVTLLGWQWDDAGDVDFAAQFAKVGLPMVSAHDQIALYREWARHSGLDLAFSTWAAEREHNGRKRKYTATTSSRSPSPEQDASCKVVNVERMGCGLKLVHDAVAKAARSGSFVLTAGGDHSVASGSISALCKTYPDLGVIWVDAHADANTPNISPSGHYHGMPAAHLMGWFGRDDLPSFEWFDAGCLPENKLAYIGLRDIDPEEGKMLASSGARVFTMRDVDTHGIAKVVQMAIAHVSGPKGDAPLHLSLDIDSVDPHFAPGTGTTARGGLNYREVHYICEECALSTRLVSMDLVEVNPAIDPPPVEAAMHGDNDAICRTSPTVRLAAELVLSALGKQIMGNMTPSQFQAIHKPTQPRITGGSPAMIRHNDMSPAMVRREQ